MRLYFSLPSPFPNERLRALFETMGKQLTPDSGAFEHKTEMGEGNPYDGYVHHHVAALTLPGRTLRASESNGSSQFTSLDVELVPCSGREWLELRELLRRELGAEHDRCSSPWVISEVLPSLERETALSLARESLANSGPGDPGRTEILAWVAGNDPAGGGAKEQVKTAPAILDGWLQLEREGSPIFEVLARLCPFELSRWKGAGLTPAPWFAHPAFPFERAPEAVGSWRSLPRAAMKEAAGLAFAASDALSGWELTKDWTIVAGEAVPQTEGWSWHLSRRARYPEGASLPVVHVSLVGIRNDHREMITWSWLGGARTGDVLCIVERKLDIASMEPVGLAFTVVGSDEFRGRAEAVVARGQRWVEVPLGQWEAPEAPEVRAREFEVVLKRLRHAFGGLIDYDMWERWGESSASPEHVAKMRAQYAHCRKEEDESRAALDALIIKTRTEAPAALAYWVAQHDTLLAEQLPDCIARDDTVEAERVKKRREQWAELREGKRSVIFDDAARFPADRDHYRRIFGMDP